MQDEPVQLAIAAGVPWIDGGLWRDFRQSTHVNGVTLSLPNLDHIAVIAHHRSMQHLPTNRPFIMTDAQHLDALALAAFARSAESSLLRPQRPPDPVDDAPLVRYVRHLLLEAVRLNVSDIHFSPDQETLDVWFRIDGQLKRQDPPPASLTSRILARLKVMANLDLTESGHAQDGAITIHTGHSLEHRFRLSIVPALYGEKAVLRRVENADQVPSIEALGLSPAQQEVVTSALDEPSGLILLTGPTGSGKTQTLSRLMLDLLRNDRHVIALEDPIERVLPGIQQIQVNPERGFGFANGLRALLRQDPDVLMIGEIRDPETAHIAIQAAQTGHLVLSTLHTRGVDDVADRLHQLGISTHLVHDSLLLVGAQRLARRLCQLCRGQGCGACQQGFHGRVGIFDLLSRNGVRLNFQHAMTHLCLRKITTKDELRRVLDSSQIEDAARAMDEHPTTAQSAPTSVTHPRQLVIERTQLDRQPESSGTITRWHIRHTDPPIRGRNSERCAHRRSGHTSRLAIDQRTADRPGTSRTQWSTE